MDFWCRLNDNCLHQCTVYYRYLWPIWETVTVMLVDLHLVWHPTLQNSALDKTMVVLILLFNTVTGVKTNNEIYTNHIGLFMCSLLMRHLKSTWINCDYYDTSHNNILIGQLPWYTDFCVKSRKGHKKYWREKIHVFLVFGWQAKNS